ncbi:MAG: cytochrome-c oxidase, cbb3-type subunit III [Pseudomonadota bacterium]
MTDIPHEKTVDPVTQVETTGHSWDGITELNNPLPRWWLNIWYVTIVWAIGYMFLMPAIPGLPFTEQSNTTGIRNHSDRTEVAAAMAELDRERQGMSTALLDASLEEIRTDRSLQQFALAMGESVFGDNRATCHGAGGRGAKGYPSLADDIWLWSGTLDGIQATIQNGIRHEDNLDTRFSLMPNFGRDGILTNDQIDDLVAHLLDISGRPSEASAVARGAQTFAQHCGSCHGADGRGDPIQGAPNLTDSEWLFGGEPSDIYASIHTARNAHMPAWAGRLDEATIKAVSVYVHSLGGGE